MNLSNAMKNIFDIKPLIIAALHLPYQEFSGHLPPMSWLEEYVLKNFAIFAENGVPAVILQDETLNPGRAKPETIAVMASLGRLLINEFPETHLGIILQAHDPTSPLAIAHACGASFVRIKVFVGSMLKAEGIQEGCGIEACDYRRSLGREDIMILADVHDRTGYPILPLPIAKAAAWAINAGADGLILTGSSWEESLRYIAEVCQLGKRKPLILGGGANENNIAEALQIADGVVVSSALKRTNSQPSDLERWDRDKVSRFMDAVRAAIQG